MRIMPLVSAITVSFSLYALVFEREALLAFAQVAPNDSDDEVVETSENAVSVVALISRAETVDSAVILRGRTEAARQVVVASETSGQVISDPIRKGAFVEEGDLMCQLAPGTRASQLAEANARLAEAQGGIPQAMATVAEATAAVREAEINLNVAQTLSEDGYAVSYTHLTLPTTPYV